MTWTAVSIDQYFMFFCRFGNLNLLVIPNNKWETLGAWAGFGYCTFPAVGEEICWQRNCHVTFLPFCFSYNLLATVGGMPFLWECQGSERTLDVICQHPPLLFPFHILLFRYSSRGTSVLVEFFYWHVGLQWYKCHPTIILPSLPAEQHINSQPTSWWGLDYTFIKLKIHDGKFNSRALQIYKSY